MGKIVNIEDKNDIFINKVSGEVTTEDILAYAVKNVPEWKKAFLIWDFTDADVHKISRNEIQALSARFKSHVRPRVGARTAFVARHDLQFGMLRMFNTFTEIDEYPYKLESFREIDKAKEWLLSFK